MSDTQTLISVRLATSESRHSPLKSDMHVRQLIGLTVSVLAVTITALPAAAEDFTSCSKDSEIPEDVRMKDEQFTEENALLAADSLSEYLKGSGWERQMAVYNRLKIIEGFMLKSIAAESGLSENADRYCEFLKTKAFYFD